MFSVPRASVPLLAGVLLLGGLAVTFDLPVRAAESAVLAPAPALDTPSTAARETAVFAGGCFWGIEGVFSHVKGVIKAESGYAGGPANLKVGYEDVSSGDTGYAESVRVTFDPHIVSYGQLLRIFFSVGADPTTLNYQGPDHGTQYRSGLFPMNPAQDKVARAYLGQMAASGVWKAKIVTRIEPRNNFQLAEDYHQNFMQTITRDNPSYSYIAQNDLPKVAALKRLFPQYYVVRPSA